MTDSEINVQAYRTMAEVLISYRKIFLRGLRKVSGESWYLDACPPGVYERLVDRKENELAFERLSVEYEDLMSFSTFEDLAEIIDYNEDLARLLRNLAASKDELCERLHELEWLRIKLAMACDLDDQEILALTARREELQQILAGARGRAQRRAGGIGRSVAPSAAAPLSRDDTVSVGPRGQGCAAVIRVNAGASAGVAHRPPDPSGPALGAPAFARLRLAAGEGRG